MAPDVLKAPLLGRMLTWRWGRLVFQVPLMVIAVLLVIDGFVGPQFAARNLATVGAWIHYRGLVVLALLLAGNLFCMGCPFTLPRTLAKRLSIRGHRFPRVLRNKWLAIAGLFGIFYLYEWLDLWASPLLTAWVIIAYFLASFVLEALFKESAFCKYVCPLGTFNFVYSTVSPTQIGVSDTQVCRDCVGKECINGSYSPQNVVLIDKIGQHEHTPQGTLGCGTELFAPQIKSNMDCTLCLDCARACPHNNVGLFVRSPGKEVTQPQRATWDRSMLYIALAFMALTNAFGMVPPVYGLLETVGGALSLFGPATEAITLLVVFGVGNLVLPLLLALSAAWLTLHLTRSKLSLREVVGAYAPAFVPLGFGVWLSHYLFHFLIGVWTIIPVAQEFFGMANPAYALGGVPPNSPALGIIETIALVGGFAASLYVAQRASLRLFKRQSLIAFIPWAFLLLLMMLFGRWVMGLPMEMRGTAELFAQVAGMLLA